jgi:predicted lipid-binding transport protein (Tim44 family)
MKQTLTTLIVIAAMAPAVWAQDRIYRCGNEYTNNAAQAKERGCKLVEGGNVTVVQGARPKAASGAAASASTTASAATPAGAPRVDNSEQRARDADARAILESELRKAEARHAELLKEYNDGAPVRNALDLRNPQVYMERTAELKASVARSESDLAGIRRELARLAPPSGAK